MIVLFLIIIMALVTIIAYLSGAILLALFTGGFVIGAVLVFVILLLMGEL